MPSSVSCATIMSPPTLTRQDPHGAHCEAERPLAINWRKKVGVAFKILCDHQQSITFGSVVGVERQVDTVM